jgi:hypothetical protein
LDVCIVSADVAGVDTPELHVEYWAHSSATLSTLSSLQASAVPPVKSKDKDKDKDKDDGRVLIKGSFRCVKIKRSVAPFDSTETGTESSMHAHVLLSWPESDLMSVLHRVALTGKRPVAMPLQLSAIMREKSKGMIVLNSCELRLEHNTCIFFLIDKRHQLKNWEKVQRCQGHQH